MECHHILEKANGGEDSFENCIPLCFDCHAEVGHYNNKHPKGVKFSAAELKAHRDKWYALVERGIANDAPADYLEMDRALFQKIVKSLGSNEGMFHFKDHHYSYLYSQGIEIKLADLLHETEMPGFEFFDLLVENAFADLKNAISSYRKASINRIWFETDGRAGIPQEWCNGEPKMEKRFDEAVEVMNKEATAVWESYCSFIREARKRLKAEVEN